MNLISFLHKYGRLKRVPRTGWLLHGVSYSDVESVGDHTLRTTIIAMILGRLLKTNNQEVNIVKILEMALLHDLAETMILDFDKKISSQVGEEFKNKVETIAEKMILQDLPVELRKHYIHLLEDFHQKNSVEARIVKSADKLEMILQALEYKSQYSNEILNDFYTDIYDIEDFSDRDIKELIERLKTKVNE
jgi:putative hydrolase of HD superfamily